MRILIFFFILSSFSLGARIQKLYEMTKWDNCPGEKMMDAFFEVNQTKLVPNKIYYSGHIIVREKIPGPLEVTLEATRCDLSMENCEKFNAVKVSGICELLKNGNGALSTITNSFRPRLNCPIHAGRYESPSTVVDLTTFAPLPVDGYTWVSTVKVSSGEGRKRKLAMCLLMETKITMMKSRKG